jgi:hypothetical protein
MLFRCVVGNDLDDGPMLPNAPPCLTMITYSLEDENNINILSIHDDTLIHESPTIF